MRKRKLGTSALDVSAVGLGCNNFGGRIDLAATQRVVHKALDLGITLFDTADIYGNSGGSEESLGRILGDRRKDIVLATKFGLPMDDAGTLRGASRALHHARGRGEPEAAAHRLDRPLPAAPARPADADRGDAARARRPRAAGQGALHRLLEPCRRAGGRGAGHGEHGTASPLSSPARTSTACSRAASSASCFRLSKARGLGSCPTSRSPAASSPASTGAARRCRRARGWRRTSATRDEFINERNWRIVERARSISPPRTVTPCSNSRSAGSLRESRGRERHRRRHHAGADRAERPRRGLDAFGGGVGRTRPDHGVGRNRRARAEGMRL